MKVSVVLFPMLFAYLCQSSGKQLSQFRVLEDTTWDSPILNTQTVADQLECEDLCVRYGGLCVAAQFSGGNRCDIFTGVSGKGPENCQLKTEMGNTLFVKMVNIAQNTEVFCNVSSNEGKPNMDCSKAFDGKYGPDNEWASNREYRRNWINVTFPDVVQVQRVVIWFRCSYKDQNKKVEFETSLGVKRQFERQCGERTHWKNCTGLPGEDFNLFGLTTSFLKITATESCITNGYNPGIREIEVWGYYL